jgi:hypothetical protein
MAWIEKHQPLVHERIRTVVDADKNALLDFAFFRNFSYGCRQVFSRERWALTGEAGWFLDPFYSPGSDFIGMGNTYITELIRADRAGEALRTPVLIYGEIFRQLYENMLTLYTGQYALFGDAKVMPMKVLWDYTYYWGVLCPIFFQERLTDSALLAELEAPLARANALNGGMQRFMREWGAAREETAAESNDAPYMLDQVLMPWFVELNRGLTDQLDRAGFKARVSENVAQLEALAGEIAGFAGSEIQALMERLPEGVMASESRSLIGRMTGAPCPTLS